MPKRKVRSRYIDAPASLYIARHAQYDFIMQQAAPAGADLPRCSPMAMTA